jgi:hypothetical protein
LCCECGRREGEIGRGNEIEFVFCLNVFVFDVCDVEVSMRNVKCDGVRVCGGSLMKGVSGIGGAGGGTEKEKGERILSHFS